MLTNRQVANLRKAFASQTSTGDKFSKTQLSRMIQSRGFLGRLLGLLIRTGLRLMESVIKPLAKSVLVPLVLTAAAASAADAGIHNKILGSGHNTTLVIVNDEMQDVLKIVKSLEDSAILLKGVSETIKSESKKQRGGFLFMLLSTLGANLLNNMLTGKGLIRAGQGTAKVGYESKRSLVKRSSLKKF